MSNIVDINTDDLEIPNSGSSLYNNRYFLAAMNNKKKQVEVSILIQAYNNLDKTKLCVNSVLDNTKDIEYELVLIDNGSTDETFEYFKSINYEKKKIIHISKNVGAGNAMNYVDFYSLAEFICVLAADMIVTPNWLSNMVFCMKSDDKIGMVNPLSSNTNALQSIEFSYESLDEMQEIARGINVSDPRKWEYRQRLVTLGTLYRKAAIYAIGWPVTDVGFFHDFADDDITFRIRRAGYKTVLAGDTWVCHNHDIRNFEGKDLRIHDESLRIGKQNFSEKYFGVDAWDDVNNYYIPYFKDFPIDVDGKRKNVLGINVKCGTPILDIKNRLRKDGIEDVVLSAYSEDPKYWLDLKTICDGEVFCDRLSYLKDHYQSEVFDYIINDQPINVKDTMQTLDDMVSICKSGGVIIFKLYNAHSIMDYLYELGEKDSYDRFIVENIAVDEMINLVSRYGIIYRNNIISTMHQLSGGEEFLETVIPNEIQGNIRKDIIKRLLIKEYIFIFVKR